MIEITYSTRNNTWSISSEQENTVLPDDTHQFHQIINALSAIYVNSTCRIEINLDLSKISLASLLEKDLLGKMPIECLDQMVIKTQQEISEKNIKILRQALIEYMRRRHKKLSYTIAQTSQSVRQHTSNLGSEDPATHAKGTDLVIKQCSQLLFEQKFFTWLTGIFIGIILVIWIVFSGAFIAAAHGLIWPIVLILSNFVISIGGNFLLGLFGMATLAGCSEFLNVCRHHYFEKVKNLLKTEEEKIFLQKIAVLSSENSQTDSSKDPFFLNFKRPRKNILKLTSSGTDSGNNKQIKNILTTLLTDHTYLKIPKFELNFTHTSLTDTTLNMILNQSKLHLFLQSVHFHPQQNFNEDSKKFLKILFIKCFLNNSRTPKCGDELLNDSAINKLNKKLKCYTKLLKISSFFCKIISLVTIFIIMSPLAYNIPLLCASHILSTLICCGIFFIGISLTARSYCTQQAKAEWSQLNDLFEHTPQKSINTSSSRVLKILKRPVACFFKFCHSSNQQKTDVVNPNKDVLNQINKQPD